jgi:septum formation protein
MLLEKLNNYRLILASQSPRRQFLMKEAGFTVEVIVPEGIEEVYPEGLVNEEIPLYLAELKASYFENKLKEHEIVISADTMVFLDDAVLGKPVDYNEAKALLTSLSGKTHIVITGVCILNNHKEKTFFDTSKVHFRNLSSEEIEYYIKNYNPYDKAGAYGAQEWIGYVGIEWIEGSYFNVMGLPIQKLYGELEQFVLK